MKEVPLSSNEIRAMFLRFFEEKGHKVIPSSSLIPENDPTLLLTTAGMVQIKPYFMGLAVPPSPRLTSCQKCFRTTDIDSVGDTQHLTFFEMLGNFSVGDYFKKEAIEWAWEFTTQRLKLPPERLWATIFLDDEEAFQLWQGVGVPLARIKRYGEKDNFWGPAGDSGPCGPCSELHYDFGEEFGCGRPECGPNCECGRFVEIWNLVFTQYNQDKDGHRTPLPRPNIDTGMGLERTVAVVQGKTSVYECDLFTPITARVATLVDKACVPGRGVKKSGSQEPRVTRGGEGLRTQDLGLRTDEASERAIRVIAEHSRAITFLIADGVIPGNEGRGYVLRRMLRRAALFGRRLGMEIPFLPQIAHTVIEHMGDIYPELRRKQDILQMIEAEEERFEQTLDTGINLLDRLIEKVGDGKRLSGKEAFMLYDTYGFPLELTSEIASEHNISVDCEEFEVEMEHQRERARASHRFNTGAKSEIKVYQQLGVSTTEFVGYDTLKQCSTVVGLLRDGKAADTVSQGETVEIIIQETPFYGEMGGQVGDKGEICGPQGRVIIKNTIRPLPELIVHQGKVTDGAISQGDVIEAIVDENNHHDIARNHTATHLLQSALRAVLGEDVHQAGSLVTPERLRFDFTRLTAIPREQLMQIQHLVNERIRENLPVRSEAVPYNEAILRGAIALFGEKYGKMVRLVEIGNPPYSLELCGGTHVASTGEIGFFHITSESSIGSGARRIEAVTGYGAEIFLEQHLSTLEASAHILKVIPLEVQAKVAALTSELDKENKQVATLEQELARRRAESLLSHAETINGIRLIAVSVPSTNPDTLRVMGDYLKEKLASGVIALGTIYDDKPYFMVMVTPDLTAKGLHAGTVVRQIAKRSGGGGGGKAELGQGSGKDKNKLSESIAIVKNLLSKMSD